MDDAHSWFYIVIFLVFIGIDFVFFAFGAAIQNLNATQTESRMEAGDKKAVNLPFLTFIYNFTQYFFYSRIPFLSPRF